MASKILITPNDGSVTPGQDPTIKYQGTGNSTDITQRVTSSGSLSFEGTSGQLFSIIDSLTGTIYAVNDISGIPSIEVLDTGVVKLAQYNGNVGIGMEPNVSYKLDINGASRSLTSETYSIFFNRVGNPASGIQWYSNGYNAWTTYMGQVGVAAQGPKGNLTPVAGTLVTTWGLRNFIENTAGYGWTFESGLNSATSPTVVAEISSVDGSARFAGKVTAGSYGNSPYDIHNFINGKPLVNEVLLRFVSIRSFTCGINLIGSAAYCTTAATAAFMIEVLKNNVRVGTLTFNIGSTTGVFVAATAITFNVGDQLALRCTAATQDATLSDIVITICCNLT